MDGFTWIIVLFIIGFYILIKSANILVSGAISLAKIFNISSWFIGIVIVGVGTSIPELAINIASAFEKNTIGLSTIIGSNTFNLLFILGVVALFHPIFMLRKWALRDLPFSIAAVSFATATILFPLVGDPSFTGVTRPEGFLLLSLLGLWIIFMFLQDGSFEEDHSADYRVFTVFTSIVMILVGILGVFFGGRWVVDGAQAIALSIGVSPTLVALTVVAIGTSVPELAVSTVAVWKRSATIAVGNVIGTNIFNFFGIVGISALLSPTLVRENIQFDIFASLIAAVVVTVLVFMGKGYQIGRREGLILLAIYLIYLVAVIWRG